MLSLYIFIYTHIISKYLSGNAPSYQYSDHHQDDIACLDLGIPIPRDPGSPNLRMGAWNLNTMRFVSVIGDPKTHPLTFGNWIPREISGFKQKVSKSTPDPNEIVKKPWHLPSMTKASLVAKNMSKPW